MHQPLLYQDRKWQNINLVNNNNDDFKCDKECCLVCGIIIIFNTLFIIIMISLIQNEDGSLNI